MSVETTGLACRLVLSGQTGLVVELEMVEGVGVGVAAIVDEGAKQSLSSRQVIFCNS